MNERDGRQRVHCKSAVLGAWRAHRRQMWSLAAARTAPMVKSRPTLLRLVGRTRWRERRTALAHTSGATRAGGMRLGGSSEVPLIAWSRHARPKAPAGTCSICERSERRRCFFIAVERGGWWEDAAAHEHVRMRVSVFA